MRRRGGIYISAESDSYTLLQVFGIPLKTEFINKIFVTAAMKVCYAGLNHLECIRVIKSVHRLLAGNVLLLGYSINQAGIFHLKYSLTSVHKSIIILMK